MNDMLIYLAKVSAGLGIIFLPYYFLFRNDPNLVLKRFYLLLGVCSAWIFPLIVFRKPEMVVNFAPIVFIDPEETSSLPITLNDSLSESSLTINWVRLLIVAYLTGTLFMFLKNLFIIIRWNITWNRTKRGDGIAFTESDQVFTLFSKIFIPRKLQEEEQDLDQVILHERAHIDQFHHVDLILMEIALLLTWFNPFSWLISRMIKENHEHLADRQVLSAGTNPVRYRAQLLNHTLGVNVFRLGNQFNHSLTLKRFNMMKKPTRSPLGIVKIAMIIPLVLITLGLTTGLPPQEKPIKGRVIFADSGEPALGASVIISGTTTGTVVDREGKFALNVKGDPEIVISFVGYASLRIKSSKIGKKPMKLERKTYKIDLADTPEKELKLEAEAITVKTKNQELKADKITITTSGTEIKNPVYVLDGEVVDKIDHLDPNLIESISVIKDPEDELVNKYNATDGLILIHSKKGLSTSEKKQVESFKKDGELFYVVEDMPMFPGGRKELKKHIYSHLKYPESAKKKGISGEVQVQFVVTTSGKLENIQVARSSYEGFNKPAIAVFNNMPDWKPGSQRGKPVKVQVVIPVRFNAGTE